MPGRPDGDLGPGGRVESVRRYEASGVKMAGMAERYWQELRPSDAGRFRLDATLRQDRDRTDRSHPTGRALRRHDDVLAVDEGAVDIEENKLQRSSSV